MAIEHLLVSNHS